MEELLQTFENEIEEIVLVPDGGGAFEITVNDQLLFSKLSMQKRHAEAGEIVRLIHENVN